MSTPLVSATLQPGQSIKPFVSMDLAKQLVKTHFGMEVNNIKEINSYDDRNFYVEVGESSAVQKFIFKVLNRMDSKKPDHVEAEHGMMFHLASKNIKCPVPHKTVDGLYYKLVPIPLDDAENANKEASPINAEKETMNLIRLLTYVEGNILHNVKINTNLLNKTGEYIARIEDLLKESKYPVLETHNTIWMLGHVLDITKFMYVIENETDKFKLVKSVLNEYKTNIVPLLPSLEKGLLHGDYNEQNILVQQGQDGEYDISGIIDFGDSHFGPYIFELAITVCYMMLESVRCEIVDPFDSVGHVVAGYSQIRKVPEEELKLIRTLVSCRLCQSLVMGAYSATQDPGNEYILTTQSRGWKLLDQIWNEKSDDQMVSMCKKYLK